VHNRGHIRESRSGISYRGGTQLLKRRGLWGKGGKEQLLSLSWTRRDRVKRRRKVRRSAFLQRGGKELFWGKLLRHKEPSPMRGGDRRGKWEAFSKGKRNLVGIVRT